MPTKLWWFGFPRMKCPHCGKQIEGIKFVGRWKLPRRGGRESGRNGQTEGDSVRTKPSAAAKPATRPRRRRGDRKRGVTGIKEAVE